jgi:glycerol uptake facilitator protein
MPQGVLGEFLGTMVLILLGNGVVAGVLLKRTKSENAGWVAITAAWGFAVMAGVFTAMACGSPGHLNPAVTVAAGVIGGDFSKAGWFIIAQTAGAMVGACLVWLHYLPHWHETADADLKRACFCTAPAIRAPFANFISEVVGTFVLVLVANAIGAKAVSASGPAAGLGPYLVGSLVWGIGLSLGGTTGYAINPARDLGPRIVHAFLPLQKKEGSDWGYAPIPIVGPIVGAILAGLVVKAVGF